MWREEGCLFKDSSSLNMEGTRCSADSPTPSATVTPHRHRHILHVKWMYCKHLHDNRLSVFLCFHRQRKLLKCSHGAAIFKTIFKRFSRTSVSFRCNIDVPGKRLRDKEVLSREKKQELGDSSAA